MTSTLKPSDVRRNAFTEDMGSDFVAVDARGNPVARASTKEGVERAAPNHHGIFSGKQLGNSKGQEGEAPSGRGHDTTSAATAHDPNPQPAKTNDGDPAAANKNQPGAEAATSAENGRAGTQTAVQSGNRKPAGEDDVSQTDAAAEKQKADDDLKQADADKAAENEKKAADEKAEADSKAAEKQKADEQKKADDADKAKRQRKPAGK